MYLNTKPLNILLIVLLLLTACKREKSEVQKFRELDKKADELFNSEFSKEILFSPKVLEYPKLQKNEIKVTLENCCSFNLPNELEIQTGSYKESNEKVAKSYGIKVHSDKLWIQQKGLNEMNKEAYKNYLRISLRCIQLSENTYTDPTVIPKYSTEELADFDKMLDEELNNFKFSSVKNIQKSRISKIGNYYGIVKIFESQMKDKPLKINKRYVIITNNKSHLVELEYWEPDYTKYESVINSVFNSLRLM